MLIYIMNIKKNIKVPNAPVPPFNPSVEQGH